MSQHHLRDVLVVNGGFWGAVEGGMLTKFKLERWAPLLVLVASTVAACEAAETNDSDTDANAADTEADDDGADSMSSDDTMSGDASSGGDPPPVDVGEPSNVRGATATACQEPGVEPDEYIFATCVGDSIPTIEGSDEWCEDGPKPFGSMAFATTNIGSEVIFCSVGPAPGFAGGAEFFNFADDYPYVIAVAQREGDSTRVDALAMSVGGGSYDVRCDPDGGFGSQTADVGAFPVGEFTCGSMTVVSAEAGQPPIVRVGPEDSPTYLQMVEL